MADQLARGEEFEKKAEKKLSGWGLFGSKYEDAADLFDKAANSFKLAKSCIFLFLSHTSIIFFFIFHSISWIDKISINWNYNLYPYNNRRVSILGGRFPIRNVELRLFFA